MPLEGCKADDVKSLLRTIASGQPWVFLADRLLLLGDDLPPLVLDEVTLGLSAPQTTIRMDVDCLLSVLSLAVMLV